MSSSSPVKEEKQAVAEAISSLLWPTPMTVSFFNTVPHNSCIIRLSPALSICPVAFTAALRFHSSCEESRKK